MPYVWHILADEDLDGPIVAHLRADGHLVEWVDEIAKGASDQLILTLAISKHVPLFTANLDYGRYIFRDALPAPSEGVIQHRLGTLPMARRIQLISSFFRQTDPTSIAGRFVTIDEHKVRARHLR